VDDLHLLAPHIIWFLKKLFDASTRSKSKETTTVLVDLADAIISCQLQGMVDCIASKNRKEAKSLLRCVTLAKVRCLMLGSKMAEAYAFATKVCIFRNSTIAGVHYTWLQQIEEDEKFANMHMVLSDYYYGLKDWQNAYRKVLQAVKCNGHQTFVTALRCAQCSYYIHKQTTVHMIKTKKLVREARKLEKECVLVNPEQIMAGISVSAEPRTFLKKSAIGLHAKASDPCMAESESMESIKLHT